MKTELKMIHKNIKLKSIYIITALMVVFSVTQAKAESATLSDNLKLHIPVIKFQKQYLSADLEYIKNSTDPMTFKVKKYAFLVTDEVPPQLYDLALVTAGDAPAIVDIKANEARLTFASSIPLACSVVYGKTRNFGAVAIDANMNGGAIIDHNPILTGLEPDTRYYYRVQGADAKGRLYWASVESFRTATANAENNNLLAIENGAMVTAVSSNFAGAKNDQSWGANSAIDGSLNSAWSSAGDGNKAFIEITLAQSEYIDSIEVFSRSMSDGSAKIRSFTITLDDGQVQGPYTLPDTQQAYKFPLEQTSSSIRLDVVSSTGGNTGLIEFSAYAN